MSGFNLSALAVRERAITLFVLVAIGAIVIGEAWSRTLAVALVAALFGLSVLGVWSFDARLATEGVGDDDRRVDATV